MKNNKAKFIILTLGSAISAWVCLSNNRFENPLIPIVLSLLFGVFFSLSVWFYQWNDRKNRGHIIKIGIDIHGMIDNNPDFFATLTTTLVENGHQVFIMTGSEITQALIAELRGYGIMWTHLFSIADYYKNKPDVQMWRDEQGRPWVDKVLWNKAKGQYAAEQGLDLVLDDSQEYAEYFTTSFAFCTIVNKSGKVRKPKAVMPPAPGI